MHGDQVCDLRSNLFDLWEHGATEIVTKVLHAVPFDSQTARGTQHFFGVGLTEVMNAGGHHTDLQVVLAQRLNQFGEVFFHAFGQYVTSFADGRFDTIETELGHGFSQSIIRELLNVLGRMRKTYGSIYRSVCRRPGRGFFETRAAAPAAVPANRERRSSVIELSPRGVIRRKVAGGFWVVYDQPRTCHSPADFLGTSARLAVVTGDRSLLGRLFAAPVVVYENVPGQRRITFESSTM